LANTFYSRSWLSLLGVATSSHLISWQRHLKQLFKSHSGS